VASLGTRVGSRNVMAFLDAVRAAVMEGPAGEAELVRALADLPRSARVLVIAALGDAQGGLGSAALRAVLAEPGASRDMRCAALLALVKRCGEDASQDLAQALTSRDGPVKDYAMLGLAGAGDDRAWESAFARLRQQLRRRAGAPSPYPQGAMPGQSPVATTICYLAQHLAVGDRRERLLREVRGQWGRLADTERAWLTEMWPDCAPEGPDEAAVLRPDADRLRRWITSGALFGPFLREGRARSPSTDADAR
jgi:hypothetical protein